MSLVHQPWVGESRADARGDPRAVLSWFAERPPVPLSAPPRFREYGPLGDDPDRPGDFPIRSIEGLAFGIEYLDLRSWTSTRVVRCLALDPSGPGYLKAWCNVRKATRTFRLDRILSTANLRTGETHEKGGPILLLAPAYLAGDPACAALDRLQKWTRSGVSVLLSLGPDDGRLTLEQRGVLSAYAREEAAFRAVALPPDDLLDLWLDNLSPTGAGVLAGVHELLGDGPAAARLMPRVVEMARLSGTADDVDLRRLISAVRLYFYPRPASASIDVLPRR